VLVEAQVGIERGLADVQAPRIAPRRRMQQRDIDAVVGIAPATRFGLQSTGGAFGYPHPIGRRRHAHAARIAARRRRVKACANPATGVFG
jgi:hypothetical protein